MVKQANGTDCGSVCEAFSATGAAQCADCRCIYAGVEPEGVMVLIEAEHMCMTMRGIKKPGTKTVTAVTRGVFDNNEELQNRFFRMIERR